MKKRIYIYELDCYKAASEEQLQRMRISPERYFNLEGLPSEKIAEKLEEFIWERGRMLAPSSMASEVTYYNNIREFLIDRKIQAGIIFRHDKVQYTGLWGGGLSPCLRQKRQSGRTADNSVYERQSWSCRYRKIKR